MTSHLNYSDVAAQAPGADNGRNPAAPAPITVRIPVAARMLGLGRSKVYELITSGDIEVVKLGRATLVPVAGLNALIDRLRDQQAEN